MIWNPNKECMSRDELRELQGRRLHKVVAYVYHNVPFYRNKMQEMDISPDDINSIDDIVKLPFTELEALVASKLKSVLSIAAKVQIKTPGTLARSEGKTKFVEDRRVME